MHDNPLSRGFDPRTALAEVDDAVHTMAENTEAPRSIMIALLAVIATTFALIDVVPWSVTLGCFGLLIPLGIWYFVSMRKRPKARTSISHSGPYMVYVLLFMLVLQGVRFWEAIQWWEICAKWLLIFGLGWFAASRMRAATIKSRVKDANGRPI